jgi:ribosomal protein S18 acetylase RimI-like enzyme
MKVERIQPGYPEAQKTWQLVSQVATDCIGFPTCALESYHKIFTKEEFQGLVVNDKIPTFFVQKNDKIIGVLIGTKEEGGVGTVIWLIVEPHHHGNGIGRALFNAACSHYRDNGCHKIKLTAPNLEAVNFYKKMGMTIEGIHPNHWWAMQFWSMGKNLT